MQKLEREFIAKDGYKVFYRKFMPETEAPVAILQIFHGMAEHSKRYEDFAEFLTQNKIAVYVSDHRGHGQSMTSYKDYGVWKNKDEWWRIVEDLKQLKDIATSELPDIPYFVMGHSMGSFLARTFITKYGNELKGVIVSGTGTNPMFALKIARCLAQVFCVTNGVSSEAKFIDKISFGGYNKGFDKPYQWLSRNSVEVEKYQYDKFCGGIFSNSFYRSFFDGLVYISKKSTAKKLNIELPMLFVSGDKDPVGNYGNGVKSAVDYYKNAGVKNIDMKLYPDARHEILNEINKDEVYNDLLNWIKCEL